MELLIKWIKSLEEPGKLYTLSSPPKDIGSAVESHGKTGQVPGPWGIVLTDVTSQNSFVNCLLALTRSLQTMTWGLTALQEIWQSTPTPIQGQELQDG